MRIILYLYLAVLAVLAVFIQKLVYNIDVISAMFVGISVSSLILLLIMTENFKISGNRVLIVPLIAYILYISTALVIGPNTISFVPWHIFATTFVYSVGLIAYNNLVVVLGRPPLHVRKKRTKS